MQTLVRSWGFWDNWSKTFFLLSKLSSKFVKGGGFKKRKKFFQPFWMQRDLEFYFQSIVQSVYLNIHQELCKYDEYFLFWRFFPNTFIVKTLFSFDRFWSLFFSYLSTLKLYYSKTIWHICKWFSVLRLAECLLSKWYNILSNLASEIFPISTLQPTVYS